MGPLARRLPLAALQSRVCQRWADGISLPTIWPRTWRCGAPITVAQALAGLDMTDVTTIEFQFEKPDATMVTRLSNGVKLVLFRVSGSVWAPCEYWHGACGERFDGPEGWAGAADGYSAPDVSSPRLMDEFKEVLADYTSRTQRPLDHVRDFLDCIRSRRTTVASPEVMYRSMNICLAADICEQL